MIIYDSSNWEKFLENNYVNLSEAQKRFLGYLLSEDLTQFISNSRTNLKIITFGGYALPFTVNSTDGGCSRDSFRKANVDHHLAILQNGGKLVIDLDTLSALQRKVDIAKYIYLNNWLLTSNQPQNIPEPVLKKFVDFLVEEYPEHFIISRAIPQDYAHSIEAHEKAGFRIVPDREFWTWRYPPQKMGNNITRDIKKLNSTTRTVRKTSEIDADTAARLSELYKKLYNDKYSRCSPSLEAKWFSIAAASKLFFFDIHYEGDRPMAFAMYSLSNRGGLVGNYMGYDCFSKRERELGTYRMLFANGILFAIEMKSNIILSGGCVEFKRNRGATREIECEGYYIKHLAPDTQREICDIIDIKKASLSNKAR